LKFDKKERLSKLAGIELDPVQTMTREQVMKAREEDAEKIRSAKVKVGIQTKVTGVSVA
jgi:hypothetical protein